MRRIKTETFLTVIAAMMVNAVLFGVGAIAILSVPALNEMAKFLLPAWIVIALIASPFIGKLIAPRMRLRYWQHRDRAHI
ncbi:hypothetical protein [Pseudorhizobium pelagicum]|uniref:hypothetical protein n=1 Tax=Pseudorhizobium pelagicum TaxID=1509405 RepID=UPI002989B4E8